MRRQRKKFFHEKTASEIKDLQPIWIEDYGLINQVINLQDNQYSVIQGRIIPPKYENARKFFKHGQDVKLRRFKSLEEAVELEIEPVDQRREAFNDAKSHAYRGYTFKPFIGTNKTTRNVSLVECVEGAKLYAYEYQDLGIKPAGITIKEYDDSNRVSQDGAEIVIEVPSRTEKESRYEIKFVSVPVKDTDRKWGLANHIHTEGHSCKSKTFNIRYTYEDDLESSNVFNFCAHEIAGYMKIMDFYLNEKKNIIPLQMNPFAIPSQSTVDFYEKLANNMLIKRSKDESAGKTTMPEREILLWGLVYKEGHDDTFFATEKVKDYSFQSV